MLGSPPFSSIQQQQQQLKRYREMENTHARTRTHTQTNKQTKNFHHQQHHHQQQLKRYITMSLSCDIQKFYENILRAGDGAEPLLPCHVTVVRPKKTGRCALHRINSSFVW